MQTWGTEAVADIVFTVIVGDETLVIGLHLGVPLVLRDEPRLVQRCVEDRTSAPFAAVSVDYYNTAGDNFKDFEQPQALAAAAVALTPPVFAWMK